MQNTTVIRNASWVVAWNEATDGHYYLRDVDVAFSGNEISHVGAGYDGPADTEISGRDLMVMPGLVNIHSHPTSEPLRKGITDETLSPNFYHSSLYEFLTIFNNDPEGTPPCHKVAMAELLQSGCTTIVDYSIAFDGWLDLLEQAGIRACIAPSFRDAPWYTKDGHLLEYDWSDSERGPDGFKAAKRLIDLANQHPSGRLTGMLAPAQIDTVSPELLRQAHNYAEERNLPMQIHAAQSVNEHIEMVRRHGCTPIQWMDQIGVLTDRTIIGHGIFLDHHPWLHWPTRQDMGLLAERGATVAHCPTVFMRRGIALNTLGGYLKAGVNMGIGTDTYPHNLLDEMRNAATVARAVAGTVADLTTADIFEAVTIGGAKALRRDDIGRLKPGAKADMVLVDLKNQAMRPMREPLRSLMYVAAERAVQDVYVDGQLVVQNGKCLTIDLDAELEALEAAQIRSMDRVPSIDYAGRSADEMAPMVYGIG
ncbi:MAG: amidohydrolase family protein [Alphaproteobacteria bacterium]|jgi:cytosine/adenosine deaminase-related metal-dependent hydrolase|nr:amidohydrolase family protein [Alphaproteobacteria bacterium]MDP7055227.1 amidohydrolase family protein [Alphaproteobacteria bacterium]MDP7230029.1 amidohydrolase family protein [Alphaproteobacteria bacterium]MDP7462149.1 amidohydrolase family protein [Alphaproteobacteria bacterium]HJM93411.1 amidohydrolase family protein [Alphaproteobacteria bacterium]|tara:strand:- start:836 stop:2275 length:1440 start_codon:yes stop_codon:yes gene_type:complete